ncbi:antibiotic biosynthesis monooxygenase [Paenibacillus sp.]|uniref:antibiotic biosynthesis monooxygenase family protein n=1 Tax=Paenibacillus sp. TaxID=58172 RepID=UPI002D49222B|nr:antibiotic biosynthesis monooxygenase [Paenibacillus sp.]HZG86737.1 antibiotic biosynthesis monooxygenase [Paenibacillus sp.]
MILETAVLHVIPGQDDEFIENFKAASKIIASMRGYLGHELQKCLEREHQYLLLVRWERLEDHTIGFRQSEPYREWKRLLHRFYDPFPVVEHYENIDIE